MSYINIRYDVFDLEREKIPNIINSFKTLGNQTISQTGFSWLGRLDEDRIVTFLEDYFEASRDIQLQGIVLTIPDRKSTRLNSSHTDISRMPSSA